MANKVRKPAKIHVRKGDTVVVVSGKYEGQKGKVSKVMPYEGTIIVDGVNMRKRHTKARPPQVPQGGIIEKAMPMHSCKVMLVCPKCDKPVRVKKIFSDNKAGRIRVCRKCGEEI
ncbi:MAG: 50S ribosomal protein L24 [bacterium]|nr:50S ribosomal protein L24 [bacterium]